MSDITILSVYEECLKITITSVGYELPLSNLYNLQILFRRTAPKQLFENIASMFSEIKDSIITREYNPRAMDMKIKFHRDSSFYDLLEKHGLLEKYLLK